MDCSRCGMDMGDREPDVASVTCPLCAMAVGKQKVLDRYSPVVVQSLLEGKGWNWTDLANKTGVAYARIMDFKHDRINAPVKLRGWIDKENGKA